MTTRFADHLLEGDHASRPVATAVPVGTLYSCSEHNVIYQSDGATWSDWATVGGGSSSGYPDGSPDKPPTVPNAKDDEFSAAGLTGWTTFGSPTTVDVDTTVEDHLYIKPTIASGDSAQGVYKTVPASYPYTLTTKLADGNLNANFNRAGLFIGDASPGKLHSIMHGYSGGALIMAQTEAASPTSSPAAAGTVTFNATPLLPVYLRIIVTSATSVTYQYSLNGKVWRTVVAADNPGFTPAVMGIWSQSNNATSGGDTAWQFFRVS